MSSLPNKKSFNRNDITFNSGVTFSDLQNEDIIPVTLPVLRKINTVGFELFNNLIDDELKIEDDDWCWSNLVKGWEPRDQENTNMCVGFAVGNGLMNILYNRSIQSPASNYFNPETFEIIADVSPRHSYMLAKDHNEHLEIFEYVLERCCKKSMKPCKERDLSVGKIVSTSDFETAKILRAIYGHLKHGFLEEYICQFRSSDGLLSIHPSYNYSREIHLNAIKDFKVKVFQIACNESEPLLKIFKANLWDEIRKWISISGPLVMMLELDLNWRRVKETKTVYLDNKVDDNVSYPHAVLITGWRLKGQKRYLKIRNSLGTGWGEGGYVFISEEYFFDTCLELYGIEGFLSSLLMNKEKIEVRSFGSKVFIYIEFKPKRVELKCVELEGKYLITMHHNPDAEMSKYETFETKLTSSSRKILYFDFKELDVNNNIINQSINQSRTWV